MEKAENVRNLHQHWPKEKEEIATNFLKVLERLDSQVWKVEHVDLSLEKDKYI